MINFSAAATPADAHDEEEIFERVDAEINPIIDEKNEEFCFSRNVKLGKDTLLSVQTNMSYVSLDMICQPCCQQPRIVLRLMLNSSHSQLLCYSKK